LPELIMHCVYEYKYTKYCIEPQMNVQLGGKEYSSNLVGLGVRIHASTLFLINYRCPMGVEVAGPCGGAARVAGPRGRGAGVAGPCGRGRLAGVGPTTMLTGLN
jgi:hypothetical protein